MIFNGQTFTVFCLLLPVFISIKTTYSIIYLLDDELVALNFSLNDFADCWYILLSGSVFIDGYTFHTADRLVNLFLYIYIYIR